MAVRLTDTTGICLLLVHHMRKQQADDKFEMISGTNGLCEAQHERNSKSEHTKRNRSPDDLRLSKKTCPEESLIQIGSMEHHVEPEVLLAIAKEYFAQYETRFGEYIHILDWGLHCDESTPHIHERHVFDCKNEYGEIAPQQEKALDVVLSFVFTLLEFPCCRKDPQSPSWSPL